MINKIFDSNFEGIKKDLLNSKFPYTGKSIYRFYLKISSLKSVLDNINSIDGYYSAKILQRALFEHLLVFYYIFTEYDAAKSDEIGIAYYRDYFIQEFFKQKGYLQKIDKIREGSQKKNIAGLDFIKSKYPELQSISETQYQDINRVANSFKVENILKQLNSNRNKSTEESVLHDKMLGFIDSYNKLSSYVHGGPFAEKEVYDDEIDLNKELWEIKRWALIALNMVKEYTLFYLGDEKREYLLKMLPMMKEREEKIKNHGA